MGEGVDVVAAGVEGGFICGRWQWEREMGGGYGRRGRVVVGFDGLGFGGKRGFGKFLSWREGAWGRTIGFSMI